jgi:hypothetical protein
MTLPLSRYLLKAKSLVQLEAWAKRNRFSKAFLLQMLAWLENQHRVVYCQEKWETSPRLRGALRKSKKVAVA